MIEAVIPANPPAEFFQQLSAQRDIVVEMMDKGILLSYGLSEDRARLWIVVVANSKEEVNAITEKFPLFKFMSFRVEPMMFYNNSKHKLPELSLN
jgi:hypothetical protein